eukprot:TRINITY_DN433_c0_g1_i8.p1 TRINITY_DN433_c0_g1~~TRINITY_DN433_c0_g1_i8.p1  ORF type:complete len:125 (-),score=31.34 TRINITY_DN433_c0_g1_i8:363-737(-)
MATEQKFISLIKKRKKLEIEQMLTQIPNLLEKLGYTPLYFAVQSGYIELCQFFIEKGVDMNQGYPLLCIAIEKDHFEICNFLIEYGIDINKGAPLCIAIEKNHIQISNCLIERGVDINKEDVIY